jgi:CHAT domain-containing protein
LSEANLIADQFKNSTIYYGTGSKATNRFLLSNQARNSAVLHIATHGLFNSNSSDIVGLLTGSGDIDTHYDFITLSELMSKPFTSRLVTISGCNTMLGKLYKGSGMRSLTRGFLAQGAGSVLGTLWAVPDRSTAKFMSRFYINLTDFDGNVSSALNFTKSEFSQKGRYRHPKYWAGFVLTVANQQYDTIKLD